MLEISDRVYVFKDGANIDVIDKKETNEVPIYEKMVGRSTTGEYFKIGRQTIPQNDIVLKVQNLGQKGFF